MKVEYISELADATGQTMFDITNALEKIGLAAEVAEADMSNLRYALKGEDSPYQKAILFAMNRLRVPIYSGTVEPEEIARRRKANKVARNSRRKNRK